MIGLSWRRIVLLPQRKFDRSELSEFLCNAAIACLSQLSLRLRTPMGLEIERKLPVMPDRQQIDASADLHI